MSEVIIETFDFAKKGVIKGGANSAFALGLKVHANAVSLAPVNYGQLRNSLMVMSNNKEEGFNSQPKDKALNSDKLDISLKDNDVAVGTNIEYAIYQEFGTKYQVAQPYLRPAGLAVRGASNQEIFKKFGREAMEKEFVQRKKKTYRYKT